MAAEYLTVKHLSLKQITRIFSKVTLGGIFRGTPCWNWNANHATYRCVKWGDHTEKAHRLLFAWLVHPLPRGFQHGEIDHLCKDKSCVNPAHLEFVPRRTNILRGRGPTAINAAKTHCAKGHPLTPRPSNPSIRICSPCHLEQCRQRGKERFQRIKADPALHSAYKNRKRAEALRRKERAL